MPSSISNQTTTRDLGWAATLAGVFAAIYALGAARTIQGGDASEFVLLGLERGGIAHPPGYPLYTLAVKLAALTGIAPATFAVSLTSVTFAASALFVVFLIARALGARPVAAAVTS
ncbi:MAG: DUF2723 domain-containing protein, partial [Myxococcales bacterium]|nr:DUF2723 domain-containing protein [Myxococcales bacterium]